jgi:predicted Zn-dependent protease
MREIRNGKLGGVITSGGFRFNASELWNSVVTLAGAKSVEEIPVGNGGSRQKIGHTVSAPAAIMNDVAIINR